MVRESVRSGMGMTGLNEGGSPLSGQGMGQITATDTRLAVIFFGYRIPNGEVPASACDGTTNLPEHSFSSPALHAALWLSSAQSGGNHQGIFVPCNTCSTIGTTLEDLPSRSTLSFSNTIRAAMH